MDNLGRRAECAALLEFGTDEGYVAHLFRYAGAKLDASAIDGDGLMVFRVHLARYCRRAELMEYYPPRDFVEHEAVDASVERVRPALIVRLGRPEADNVVAVLEELKTQAFVVGWAATRTVVTGDVKEGVENAADVRHWYNK